MPIYAYKCGSCGHAKDVLQKLSDAQLTVCPECGAHAFSKQLTAAGFQLKGSGWYVTDFRNNAGDGKKSSADKSAETGAEKGSDASTGANEGKSADRPAEKSAEKPAEKSAEKSVKTAPAPAPAPASASAPAPAAKTDTPKASPGTTGRN